MSGRRRHKAEHTEDWERLLPLFEWPEQERYEAIRPLVLFGDSVAERAQEVVYQVAGDADVASVGFDFRAGHGRALVGERPPIIAANVSN
jgi:hypothetical protein